MIWRKILLTLGFYHLSETKIYVRSWKVLSFIVINTHLWVTVISQFVGTRIEHNFMQAESVFTKMTTNEEKLRSENKFVKKISYLYLNFLLMTVVESVEFNFHQIFVPGWWIFYRRVENICFTKNVSYYVSGINQLCDAVSSHFSPYESELI